MKVLKFLFYLLFLVQSSYSFDADDIREKFKEKYGQTMEDFYTKEGGAGSCISNMNIYTPCFKPSEGYTSLKEFIDKTQSIDQTKFVEQRSVHYRFKTGENKGEIPEYTISTRSGKTYIASFLQVTRTNENFKDTFILRKLKKDGDPNNYKDYYTVLVEKSRNKRDWVIKCLSLDTSKGSGLSGDGSSVEKPYVFYGNLPPYDHKKGDFKNLLDLDSFEHMISIIERGRYNVGGLLLLTANSKKDSIPARKGGAQCMGDIAQYLNLIRKEKEGSLEKEEPDTLSKLREKKHVKQYEKEAKAFLENQIQKLWIECPRIDSVESAKNHTKNVLRSIGPLILDYPENIEDPEVSPDFPLLPESVYPVCEEYAQELKDKLLKDPEIVAREATQAILLEKDVKMIDVSSSDHKRPADPDGSGKGNEAKRVRLEHENCLDRLKKCKVDLEPILEGEVESMIRELIQRNFKTIKTFSELEALLQGNLAETDVIKNLHTSILQDHQFMRNYQETIKKLIEDIYRSKHRHADIPPNFQEALDEISKEIYQSTTRQEPVVGSYFENMVGLLFYEEYDHFLSQNIITTEERIHHLEKEITHQEKEIQDIKSNILEINRKPKEYMDETKRKERLEREIQKLKEKQKKNVEEKRDLTERKSKMEGRRRDKDTRHHREMEERKYRERMERESKRIFYEHH